MNTVYTDLLAKVLPSITHTMEAVLAVLALLVGTAYARFGVAKVHGLFVTDPHDQLPEIESARFGGAMGQSSASFYDDAFDIPVSRPGAFPVLDFMESSEDFVDTVAAGSGSAFKPSFPTHEVWTDELMAARQAEFSAFQKSLEGIAEDASFDAMYADYETRRENGDWPELDGDDNE